jgi:hypothetical protein
MGAHGELAGEGKEGEGGEGRGHGLGATWGAARGHHGRGCRRCSLLAASCSLLRAVCRKETGRRREEKRREEREEKKKGKKEKKEMNFFLNLEISEKIKDNLWSWSKIIFVKERYVPYYK